MADIDRSLSIDMPLYVQKTPLTFNLSSYQPNDTKLSQDDYLKRTRIEIENEIEHHLLLKLKNSTNLSISNTADHEYDTEIFIRLSPDNLSIKTVPHLKAFEPPYNLALLLKAHKMLDEYTTSQYSFSYHISESPFFTFTPYFFNHRLPPLEESGIGDDIIADVKSIQQSILSAAVDMMVEVYTDDPANDSKSWKSLLKKIFQLSRVIP